MDEGPHHVHAPVSSRSLTSTCDLSCQRATEMILRVRVIANTQSLSRLRRLSAWSKLWLTANRHLSLSTPSPQALSIASCTQSSEWTCPHNSRPGFSSLCGARRSFNITLDPYHRHLQNYFPLPWQLLKETSKLRIQPWAVVPVANSRHPEAPARASLVFTACNSRVSSSYVACARPETYVRFFWTPRRSWQSFRIEPRYSSGT